MSDKKVYPQSQLPIRKTVDLLPSVFKTSNNDKFLSGVLDPMVQPGTLEKISGYLGRQYGKTFNSSDVYLDVEKSLRSAYKLEPGVVHLDNEKITDFYDYIDFKNQLAIFNNDNEDDTAVTLQNHYTWNPPIDWDKFINFREYYWLPEGPPAVPVLGQTINVSSTYSVSLGIGSSFIFSPDGLTNNPLITLYRGQTYRFNVDVPGEGFFIRTNYDTGSLLFNPNFPYSQGQLVVFADKIWRATRDLVADPERTVDQLSGDWELLSAVVDRSPLTYSSGVTNNGIENGIVEFTVPYDAPDRLFYQGGVDPNRVGQFFITDAESNTVLNIDNDIIGKQSFTSSNGIKFTNGLVVEFRGLTVPEKYNNDTWLVEGVGRKITLTRFRDLVVPAVSKESIPVVLFDNQGFDVEPFDDATNYPKSKDYITVKKDSKDLNPWSRYNRWFHSSVIEYAYSIRGQDFNVPADSRAKRPILEFKSGLQLINHGSTAKQSVDYVDTSTTDVFSTIEGSPNYSVDGEFLFDGARILVTADSNVQANNRIYQVKYITFKNKKQISLIQPDDSESRTGEGVLVVRGKQNAGRMFHFTGQQWIQSQEKVSVNQPPLFDVFDNNGISFSDQETYPISTFSGTQIIGYKPGKSLIDSELGFSLSYLNIDNVGDILFNWNWEVDNFTYVQDRTKITLPISSGYYKFSDSGLYENGWQKFDSKFSQPIIETIVVENATDQIVSRAVDWKQVNFENTLIRFYRNNEPLYEGCDWLPFERSGNSFKFQKSFDQQDVICVKVIGNITPDLGYYEFPVGLEKNPLNDSLTEFTLGQATDHLMSGLEFESRSIPCPMSFTKTSNLRDIDGYQKYAERFLKHDSIAPIAVSLMCDKENNIIKSMQYAKKAYSDFKNNFLEKAIEIEFNDDVPSFVDDIITALTKTKNANSVFAGSDMVGSGAYNTISYQVEDPGIRVFALSQRFSLTEQSNRAVYVYINGQQLLNGRDYEFSDTFGFVSITSDINEFDNIEIREYVSTSSNFIPPTPTSFGLYKKYTPAKFIDDTYLEPKEVIQGHDGSITLSFGDYRDDLLLELEYRIYNNIKLEYQPDILDIDNIIGGYYGNAIYTKEQFDNIAKPEFLKWLQNTNINFVNNSYYRETEPFTYTYSNMIDPTRTQNLPGWWRGVYQWFYDTDRPHRSPWEMLGFSEKPNWWEEEYGPAPYTRNNLILWEDLRDGIIRQGSRAGTYARYARPSLMQHIPVDSNGNLISPLDSNLSQNFILLNATSNFEFGDISPVEYAWRSSSEWPFVVMIALSILQPFSFISTAFNRNILQSNKLGQTVTSTGNFVTVSELITPLTNTVALSGISQYLKNYINSKGNNLDDVVSRWLTTDVRLASRLSGFVDKQQQKFLLDSKNPSSNTGGIFIPQENYDIFFNISSPIAAITYSGVIIEKSASGWIINGYDQNQPFFNYFEAVESQKDPAITVGGISANFTIWTPERSYSNGQIVEYQSNFYRANRSHTSNEVFDNTAWRRIPKLPIVGGVSALRRTKFNTLRSQQIGYGTTLSTVQQVVDFLLGYGEYLKTQGFVFNGYDFENQASQDWVKSCKEYMFWTSHNWANGSLITLSPASDKVQVEFPVGVAEDLLDGFYGYQVLKSDGVALQTNFLDVTRTFQTVTIEPRNINDGIYFIKLFYVLKEHVVIFDNKTVFNDVIYDAPSGYRQMRIKTLGFRTIDWDGDYTSPGFIFDNINISAWKPFVNYKLGDIVEYRTEVWAAQTNHVGSEQFDESKWRKTQVPADKQLVANFDYRVNQISDYYSVSAEGLGTAQRSLARHLIGYQPREYLSNLAEDEVTQFQLYRGFIREKGTISAISKVFDKISRNNEPSVSLKEEWAFKVGEYGGTDQIIESEFTLQKENFKVNPQPLLLVDSLPSVVVLDKNYRVARADFTVNNYNLAVNVVSDNVKLQRTAGYVATTQIDRILKTKDDILDLEFEDVPMLSHLWITFNSNTWTVLRYDVDTDLKVVDALLSGEVVSLSFNDDHNFSEGDIISVYNVVGLSKFYKIIGATSNSVIIEIDESVDEVEVIDDSTTGVGYFTDARYSSLSDVDTNTATSLPIGSKLWIDNNGDDNWIVIEKRQQTDSGQLLGTAWTILNQQLPLIDVDKVLSIALYDPKNNLKIQDLDFIDAPKGKILNVAEQEIKFKTMYDPAVYSFADIDRVEVDETIAWAEKHVGELWWDLSTVKWVEAEQQDISYRISKWNELAVGASIDVYEWVETELLPDEWEEVADTNEGITAGISGTPKYIDTPAFTVKEYRNPATEQITRRTYYYWVKNTVIIPRRVIGRRRSAAEVAALIANPKSSGIAFVALVDSDKFLAYNFRNILRSDSALFNIQYKQKNTVNNIHREFQLLTEDDELSTPSTPLETKWIDSLIGLDNAGNRVPDQTLPEKQKYGISFRPRQTMFVNSQTALELAVKNINRILITEPFSDLISLSTLSSAEAAPEDPLNLYDVVVPSKIDLDFVGVVRVRQAILDPVIIDGQIVDVTIVDSGFGYRKTPPVVVEGNGAGAEVSVTLDRNGRIMSASVIRPGRNYTNATLHVRAFSVLVESDEEANNFWSIYSWDSGRKQFFRDRTQKFNTRRLWDFVDWWKDGYSPQDKIVKEIPAAVDVEKFDLAIGDLIRIKEYGSGGWAVFEKFNSEGTQFLDRYTLIGREQGTLQILELAFNPEVSGKGYDSPISAYDLDKYSLSFALELRNIFRAVKEDIFIGNFNIEWNRLFFSSVRYAFSEQLYVDWAFKTSFLSATHNVGQLIQKVNYQSDSLDSFKEYIEEVKPFRTTIREYISRYTNTESANTIVGDFDLPAAFSDAEGKITRVTTDSPLLTQMPWKLWADNNKYSVVGITVTDAGDQYAQPPAIRITGDGTGASAKAYVSNGKITSIQIINGGVGYTHATVSIIGGNLPGGNVAKASVVLGNAKVRTFDVGIKFDRITKLGNYRSLIAVDEFTASGATAAFDLSYPPILDSDKVSVTINSQIVISNEFRIEKINRAEYETSKPKGKIVFFNIPEEGDIIKVQYEKDDSILDSVNRINKYYSPTSGMRDSDPAQLMTGIDFGGVIVQGTTFDVTGGWDALPWFTDSWDSIESSGDFFFVINIKTLDSEDTFKVGDLFKADSKVYIAIDLPYMAGDFVIPGTTEGWKDYWELYTLAFPTVPESGQEFNVYYKSADKDTALRIDDKNYNSDDNSIPLSNINAVMPTIISDGSTIAVDIQEFIELGQEDVVIIRKLESDGAVVINDTNLLDTNISGGAYSSATGIAADDIVIDGEKFISPDQVSSPEENIPGQVLDSVSIKVFNVVRTGPSTYETPTAYQIHKDMFNTNRYNRFSQGDITLAKQLNYYDQTIELSDASDLVVPDRNKKLSGTIYINGERIEYLQKTGNVLSQIRRGVHGTSIPETHPAGSLVSDVGTKNVLPYKEAHETKKFDGLNTIDITYDGSTNQYVISDDLFVGRGEPGNFYIEVVQQGNRTILERDLDYSVSVELDNVVVQLFENVELEIDSSIKVVSLLVGPLPFTPANTNDQFWYRNTIPADYGQCNEVEVFVGGQRLRKMPVSLYDEQIGYNTKTSNSLVEAEFASSGNEAYIRLTNIPAENEQILVVRRTGNTWHESGTITASAGKSLITSNTVIANFIVEKTTELPE